MSCMCRCEQGRGQAYTFPTIPERVLKESHSASCAGLWSSRAAGGNIQNFMATVPQLCVLLHCVCAALHDSFSLIMHIMHMMTVSLCSFKKKVSQMKK